jgi:hypothetical protein
LGVAGLAADAVNAMAGAIARRMDHDWDDPIHDDDELLTDEERERLAWGEPPLTGDELVGLRWLLDALYDPNQNTSADLTTAEHTSAASASAGESPSEVCGYSPQPPSEGRPGPNEMPLWPDWQVMTHAANHLPVSPENAALATELYKRAELHQMHARPMGMPAEVGEDDLAARITSALWTELTNKDAVLAGDLVAHALLNDFHITPK